MKLHSHLRTLALLALCLAARPAATQAALTTTDQQNTSFDLTNGSFIGSSSSGYGQSFTPVLGTLNAATFLLAASGPTSTVQLRLFAGAGYGGTLLAASAPVTFTNTATQTTEFDFAAPVILTPGATYTLQLADPNSTGFIISYSDANPYAGGTVYFSNGTAGIPFDFVFAEGTNSALLVPEPSTWAMVGLGAAGAVLTVLRRRRLARA